MTQDKIKSKIDEANEVLRKVIDLLAGLKAKLVEAEKPELKHLDFGENTCQRWIKVGKTFYWIHKDRISDISILEDKDFLDTIKGNLNDIFDDLEAIAKPLRKFKTDVHCYYIESEHYPCVPIYMAGNHHSIEEVKEHIRKLQRLIRTAEQEAANE